MSNGDEELFGTNPLVVDTDDDGLTDSEEAELGSKGNVEDSDGDVRYAAVKALAELAEKGNTHAITAVASRLEDSDGNVRKAAVKACVLVASPRTRDGEGAIYAESS